MDGSQLVRYAQLAEERHKLKQRDGLDWNAHEITRGTIAWSVPASNKQRN
jgi:hypothetical protein